MDTKEAYPRIGMDLVGTSFFCGGSFSFCVVSLTSQGFSDSGPGSDSQDSLQQWTPGMWRGPAATRQTQQLSRTFYAQQLL